MTSTPSPVGTLYRMELRTMLRDRRMVVMSLVLPLLVMPIMLFAGRWAEERRERQLAVREYRYAVAGPRANEARVLVESALAAPASGPSGDRATFREIPTTDAAAGLESRDLDLYLEAGSVSDLVARASSAENPERVDPEERLRALPADLLAISVVFRGDRDQSEAGAERLDSRLRDARLRTRSQTLAKSGLAIAPEAVLPIEPVNLAAETQVAGLMLGRLATVMLMFFLFMGGAVVAQDTLAGEKERGTLETLLTTAANRRDIVTAKLLLVLTVAVVITTIQVGNLLAYARLQLIPSAALLADVVTLPLALGLLLFLLPLAALISATLLLVSGYAKSYREAQFNFMPVLLLGALPALAAALPGLSLRSAIVAVPIANISVVVRELLVGRADWPFLVLAWLVTAGAAAWVVRMAERVLSTERLIVPSASDAGFAGGGRRLTPGAVFSWFAVMWAILLLISLNMGPQVDIRLQLLINLVGVFLTGSLLFLKRFKLPVRETLLLEPVRWQIWIGVAAGAPAALVAGIAVARLANLVVPVPREVLESFGQYLLPNNINYWVLLPALTILPGVCEEIAFRGVLLQSLRRFYSPWKAVLIVGLTFGFFHVSLFRLFPTAFLGLLLGAVTVLSGSILPAMVWHGLNNGIATGAAHFGIALDVLSPGLYAAAVAILALSFWILWRVGPSASPRQEIRA